MIRAVNTIYKEKAGDSIEAVIVMPNKAQ